MLGPDDVFRHFDVMMGQGHGIGQEQPSPYPYSKNKKGSGKRDLPVLSRKIAQDGTRISGSN